MRDTTEGFSFEKGSNLRTALENSSHFDVREDYVYFVGTDICLGILVEKGRLKKFLKNIGICYSDFVEKMKLPDNAFIHLDQNGNPIMLTIIEAKSQNTHGSADEKITTGPYVRKYYLKMLRSLGIRVDYSLVLSDWFKKGYRDELEYLQDENIQYYFNRIPIDKVFPFINLDARIPRSPFGRGNPDPFVG